MRSVEFSKILFFFSKAAVSGKPDWFSGDYLTVNCKVVNSGVKKRSVSFESSGYVH
jgi:hypothetical protein